MNTATETPASSTAAYADDTPAAGYKAQEVLTIAIEVGAETLRSGGDVHRVEDTMTRICAAYGAVRSDIFAITSLITATVTMPDGSCCSEERRITRTYNHLARLEEVNALSRSICARPIPLTEVEPRLDEVRRFRPVPEWMCYLGGFFATGGFAVFFGGGILDGLAAGCIGLILTLIARTRGGHINAMAGAVINAFIAGVLSVLCVRVGFGAQVDKIISGTIMLEIPGLSIGNGIRDLLWGDTVTGALRLIQALVQALMMALGYLAALVLWARIPGGMAV